MGARIFCVFPDNCAFLHNIAKIILAAMTYIAADSPLQTGTRAVPQTPPTPTPLRARRVRHDGWTDAKRAAFLDALGHSGALKEAAALVGMSRMSVWRLRVRDAEFDAACHARQREGVLLLREIAQARARQGLARPIFDASGTQVGTHVRLDCAMLMFLLTRYDMEVIGPPRDAYASPDPADARKRIMPQSERELRAILAARRVEQAARIMDEIEDRLDADDFADLYSTPDIELTRDRDRARAKVGEVQDEEAKQSPHVQSVQSGCPAQAAQPAQPAQPAQSDRPALPAPKVTYPLNLNADAGQQPIPRGEQDDRRIALRLIDKPHPDALFRLILPP